MTNKFKRAIEIETSSREERMKVGTAIHEQLRGNPDYINNNIILDCTTDDNMVRLIIFEECKEIPNILI